MKSPGHPLSVHARWFVASLIVASTQLAACGVKSHGAQKAPAEPLVPSDAGTLPTAAADAAPRAQTPDGKLRGDAQLAPDARLSPVAVHATVSGLLGQGLMLQSSAGEQVTVARDGRVDFSRLVARLDDDVLSVAAQPVMPSQTCTAVLREREVAVHCTVDSFALGGTASGLSGTGLVLRDQRGELLTVSASGAFSFATRAPDLTAYSVSVETQPSAPKQLCAVENGAGVVAGRDVTSVRVTCQTERFGIAGSVQGLLGDGLVLELTGGEQVSVAADGPFAFNDQLADGSAYAVRVKTQPSGPEQRCTVIAGTSTLSGASVSNVSVVCGGLGGLRISEVGSCYYSNSGCWFELYNAGSSAEELSYYRLRSPSTRRVAPYTVSSLHDFALPKATLSPGEYLVVQGASSGSLPDGQGAIHLIDAGQLPWWNQSGFVELTTAGQTIDFVRFGESQVVPLSPSAFRGPAVQGLPSAANSYGYAIARGAPAAESNDASDWTVRAFATPGGPNDVTSDADSDRDGVPDSAEVSGGRFAGLDLYAMGARVGPRDVFVEIDRMAGDDVALTPKREALDKLVSVFKTRNIAIHFDVGSLYAASFSPEKHNLGGGNVVPFAKGIAFGSAEGGLADLYDYKAAHMVAARRSLFYYMLFAWSQNEDGSGGSSGIGERPGNDTIITLGGWGLSSSTSYMRNLIVNYQAATMMHELGHNMGLRHGGGDDLNRKPNYLSVMNYLYSPAGLPTIGEREGDRYDLYRRCSLFSTSQLTNAPTADPSGFVLDFSNGTSADLLETDIVERDGLGRRESSLVDFNCNGRPDAPYARDLNADGSKDALLDHDDWGQLDFVFRRSYSGNENGTHYLFKSVSAARDDLLTDETQFVPDEPCPPPSLPR